MSYGLEFMPGERWLVSVDAEVKGLFPDLETALEYVRRYESLVEFERAASTMDPLPFDAGWEKRGFADE